MFPKEFVSTPIHVLCSSFTAIVCREEVETMRCLADKKLHKCCFFRRNFGPVWQRAIKVCNGACHVTLRLTVKFRSNRFRFAKVIPEKVISYDHSICHIHAITTTIDKSSSGDEIPERDVTYHLLCLLIYHCTTTDL